MPKRKANGEGFMRRLSSGRWEIRVYFGGRPKSFYTPKGATREEAMRLKQIKLLEAGQATEVPKMLIGELMGIWLEHIKPEVSPATFVNYQRYYRLAKPVHSEMVGGLSVARLDGLYRELVAQGYVKTTVSYVASVLKRFYRWAMRLGYVKQSPAELAVLPKQRSERRAKAASASDLQALLAQAAKENHRHLVMIMLGAYAGLRRGEMCALRWSNIDWAKSVLRIEASLNPRRQLQAPKTPTSKRTVPIPSTLKLALLKLWCLQDGRGDTKHDIVLLTSRQNFLRPEDAYTAFSKVARNAGVEHYRLHDLRHTYTKNLLDLGIKDRTVAALLGHTTPTFTIKHYDHSDNESMAKAAQTLNNTVPIGPKRS